MPVFPLHHHTQKEEVITTRPSATALLVVDSADRNPSKTTADDSTTAMGMTPYDFSIAKSQNVLSGFVKRIAVSEVAFPWSIMNINDTCNKIYYTSNQEDGPDTPVVKTIPNGFYYLPTDLANAITSKTASSNITCNWDARQCRFYFTGDDGDFTICPPATTGPTGEGPTLTNSPYKSLFDILGMVYSQSNTYDNSTKFAGHPPLMRWTDYVDITCSNLTQNQCIKDYSTLPSIYNPKNLLCRLYLDDENPSIVWTGEEYIFTSGTRPYTIYRQFRNPKQIEWDEAQPIPNLVFQVYDDQGRILSSGDATFPDYALPDWKMTLLVSED